MAQGHCPQRWIPAAAANGALQARMRCSPVRRDYIVCRPYATCSRIPRTTLFLEGAIATRTDRVLSWHRSPTACSVGDPLTADMQICCTARRRIPRTSSFLEGALAQQVDHNPSWSWCPPAHLVGDFLTTCRRIFSVHSLFPNTAVQFWDL